MRRITDPFVKVFGAFVEEGFGLQDPRETKRKERARYVLLASLVAETRKN